MTNDRASSCCPDPTSSPSRRRLFGLASAVPAFSAAGLAGVACMGCIPVLGTAIAGTALAASLDEHLLFLQLGLVAASVVGSILYLRSARFGRLRLLGIATGYSMLVLNLLTLQSRAIAVLTALALALLHIVRTSRRRSSEVLLLGFSGCPNLPIAREVLRRHGITSFREVDLEALSEGDPLRSFASPSLLFGDQLLFGARTTNGSLSCSFVSEPEMALALRPVIGSHPNL